MIREFALRRAPALFQPALQQRRGLFGQNFDVGSIQAIRRDVVGSRFAQRARQHKLIPGIVYGFDSEGRDEVDLVYVRELDLRREVTKRGVSFNNTLFDM
jgi:ribosomal protein L25 (general stress protein Ctc)